MLLQLLRKIGALFVCLLPVSNIVPAPEVVFDKYLF